MDYDVIGFLMTGPKSRRDFWRSEDFFVPQINRGICPYKLLNDLLESGFIEKIPYSYDSKWKYTPTQWKLTDEFKEDQKTLESDTDEREKDIDEITIDEINRLRSIEGTAHIHNNDAVKITVKIAETRKNIYEMVHVVKKMHKEGVKNEK